MRKDKFSVSDSFNITVTYNGVRIYIPFSSLKRRVNLIKNEAIALTNKYSSNEKFPTNVGGDSQLPIYIRKQVLLLDYIRAGNNKLVDGTPITPELVFNAISDIKSISKNKITRSNAFYMQVGKYYGVKNATPQKVQKALEGRHLRVPQEDLENAANSTFGQGEYAELKAWILDNIPNSNAAAIKNISSAIILKSIIDDWENEGYISSKYTQRYKRKTKGAVKRLKQK